MSASEKLKALGVSRAIDWPAPSYEAYRLAEDQERLRKNAIERALPQIVVVVEAAERLDADLETNSAAGSPNYMIAALAALDEALT